MNNGRDCKHGQLARSCEICGLEAENAQLKESRDEYSEAVERLSVNREEMLKDRVALAIENERIKDDLNWVERCANHHGQKASITPAQALSFIQHYPPIKAITKAYSDGKMPTTLDPYAEIAALKAELAARWIPITERLPEPEVSVLCYGPNTIQPDLPWIMFVDWRGSKPDFGRGVTHWRPLPAGPGANHG